MTIYVVSEGQTLYSIAQSLTLPAELLAQWNGLHPPYGLAVGQSLLALRPAQVYTVQRGDTLSSIARSSGQPIGALLRANPGLGGLDRLQPGQVLALGLQEVPGRTIEVNGYAYPFADSGILRSILPFSGELTPFTYGIAADGTLVSLHDEGLLALARQYGVRPVMHLSTLTEEDTFSTARAGALLADRGRQDRLIAEVVRVMGEKGYRGLDLDFEFLGSENAGAYAQFAGRLRQAVNGLGAPLITALAPKTADDQPGLLYEGHDYGAIAENSDAVLLMTYEWGYTYGPPMAVAPLNAVRRVVEYALRRMPAEKILLGFPNYAYDWTLPFEAGASRARSISNAEAAALAVRFGAQIRYDEAAQTPWFTYTSDGAAHEVWFEDPRSALAKYGLVDTYGLRGIGFWNYMRPFSAGFSLLGAMFRTRADA